MMETTLLELEQRFETALAAFLESGNTTSEAYWHLLKTFEALKACECEEEQSPTKTL